jgi:hypothetical protein
LCFFKKSQVYNKFSKVRLYVSVQKYLNPNEKGNIPKRQGV